MLNNISIAGRLTKAPELKMTNNNRPVLSFCIAVEEDFGENRQADFIDCVAWNKTAEFISKYFDRGDLILITGRLKTRKWEDNNGAKRKETEVWVTSAYFGGNKKQEPEHREAEAAPPVPPLPFDPIMAEEAGQLPFNIEM